jgi:hypothetical protein
MAAPLKNNIDRCKSGEIKYKSAAGQEIVGEKNPEFWPECKCPFFTLPTGRLSCYGDEVATTLRCLAQRDGEVDVKAITSAIGKMSRPTDINFTFIFLPC